MRSFSSQTNYFIGIIAIAGHVSAQSAVLNPLGVGNAASLNTELVSSVIQGISTALSQQLALSAGATVEVTNSVHLTTTVDVPVGPTSTYTVYATPQGGVPAGESLETSSTLGIAGPTLATASTSSSVTVETSLPLASAIVGNSAIQSQISAVASNLATQGTANTGNFISILQSALAAASNGQLDAENIQSLFSQFLTLRFEGTTFSTSWGTTINPLAPAVTSAVDSVAPVVTSPANPLETEDVSILPITQTLAPVTLPWSVETLRQGTTWTSPANPANYYTSLHYSSAWTTSYWSTAWSTGGWFIPPGINIAGLTISIDPAQVTGLKRDVVITVNPGAATSVATSVAAQVASSILGQVSVSLLPTGDIQNMVSSVVKQLTSQLTSGSSGSSGSSGDSSGGLDLSSLLGSGSGDLSDLSDLTSGLGNIGDLTSGLGDLSDLTSGLGDLGSLADLGGIAKRDDEDSAASHEADEIQPRNVVEEDALGLSEYLNYHIQSNIANLTENAD